MDTPFYDAVARAACRGPRFFVPGHKGNAQTLAPLAGALPFDLTEVDGVDDLSHPTGPLAQSQANMARAFGSGATLYSASGSTSCIMAMLALFVGQGGQVVMARGCHASAIRALALLDATPHWVPLYSGCPRPADIERTLANTGAGAVYLTTVDYYGAMPDVAAIAAVCQQHGAALLCDNAHGAFLRFMHPNRHPISLGASACADSAHKTFACLTPAALLHLQTPTLAEEARQMLNLFSSTSPAYPVLVSLDLMAGQLLNTPPNFEGAAARLAQTAAGLAPMALPCADPLRLRLLPALMGIDPLAFKQSLLAQGIAAEYFDGDSLIFMAGPANTEADFIALEKALHHTINALPKNAAFCQITPPPALWEALPLPKVACAVRHAFFAKNKERIPTQEASGRIAAAILAPCPPGVPLVVPGEIISGGHAAALSAGGILQVDVIK